MLRRSGLAFLMGVSLGLLTGGCPVWWLSPPEAGIPAEFQFVLDRAAEFIAPTDDPLQTIAPGTVLDDLSALDGCWGAWTEGTDPSVGFGDVVHFERAAGHFTRWSGVGTTSGGLAPLFPVVAVEVGSFQVTGPATVLLVTERIQYDVEGPLGPWPSLDPMVEYPLGGIERPSLVTLQGDRMLFYLDAERAGDIEEETPRMIFRRFDCAPAASR
jgi:hypothetical protein